MKQCPRCNQTYSDDQLNFCLNDGEMLTELNSEPPPTRYADDPPPTMLMNDARVTNPTNWPASPSSTQWQPQPMVQNRPYAPMQFARSTDQTIPTISMILGILSIPLFCCFGGIWLGLPAAILGFMGMRNADSDSVRYGGRGMAIAGMVLGVIGFLSSLVYAFFAILTK